MIDLDRATGKDESQDEQPKHEMSFCHEVFFLFSDPSEYPAEGTIPKKCRSSRRRCRGLIRCDRAAGGWEDKGKQKDNGQRGIRTADYFGARLRMKLTRCQRSVSERADLNAGMREPGKPFVIHSKSWASV